MNLFLFAEYAKKRVFSTNVLQVKDSRLPFQIRKYWTRGTPQYRTRWNVFFEDSNGTWGVNAEACEVIKIIYMF